MIVIITQCTSSNSTRVTVTTQPPVTYMVQLINQAKKSEYTLKKLSTTACFSSLDILKQEIQQLHPDARDTYGYINPGHGLKGKLKSITTEQDLVEMYSEYKNKHDILLWCYVGCEDPKQHKRPATSTSSKQAPAPKRNTCESTIITAQQLVEELKEKHGSKYTVERLNAWAHMINMGKHSSLDDPPDYLFLENGKQRLERQHHHHLCSC